MLNSFAKYAFELPQGNVGQASFPVVYAEPDLRVSELIVSDTLAAGIAALSVWGLRYLPDFMTSARTRLGPGASDHRRMHLQGLGDVMTAGMSDVVAADVLEQPWPMRSSTPF